MVAWVLKVTMVPDTLEDTEASVEGLLDVTTAIVVAVALADIVAAKEAPGMDNTAVVAEVHTMRTLQEQRVEEITPDTEWL